MTDLPYAFRSLRHSAGFASVVVISLALGIGANTALFSLVNRLLIKSLPVKEPGQLVHVRRVVELGGGREKDIRLAATEIEALARNSVVFSDATGFLNLDRPTVIVNGGMEPPLGVQKVLPRFFDTLGLPMAVGAGQNNVRGAVISHRYWKVRFGRTDVLGSSLNIDGQPYPILGVAPNQFQGLELETSPSIWIWSNAPSVSLFEMVGRLRPQVGPAEAEIAMSTMFQELSGQQFGGVLVGVRVDPCGQGISIMRAEYGRPLVALLVLAALVLLATCANVGVLLAVRNATRARELAIRVSMGATQSRLVAQLLIEGAILAAGGAVLALPIARVVVTTILSMLPAAGEALVEFRVDSFLLSFVIVVSLVCTLLFAMAPAWRATGPDLLAQGLQVSCAATLPRSSQRLQRILVAVQASLSVVVLIGAGLFLQTLRNLSQAKPGFDSNHLLQVSVDPEGSGYRPNQMGSLYRRLTARLEAIPGVESVSGVRNSILRGRLSGWSEVEQVEVGPAFFETMRIPLIKGRYLAGLDHTLAGFDAVPIGAQQSIYLPKRVVISESLAEHLFGGADPIGQRLPEPLRQRPTIIGVVRDARFSTLRADPRPPIYVSQGPEPNRFNGILIRVSGNPSAVAATIQQEVRREHPRLLLAVHTIREEMDNSIARERMAAAISALFGTLGLVLVCVGVFGVAAYTVALRRKELGIRIALGASNWDVIRESLHGTLLAFIAGLMAGIMLAVAGMRLVTVAISGLLYGLTPADSLNILLAVCVMLAAVIAASVLPAYHAASVDPYSVIRSE